MSLGRVGITGGAGQLAGDLAAALRERGCEVSAPSRSELDVADDDAVGRWLGEARPEVVFNCAAFHNVDLCEREEDRAFAVNARAVKRLAERCAEAGTGLVHLSTNYVFAGDASAPYGEDDRPSPRSAYAMSKLAGEHAALAYCPRALVVRTAGLYGLQGSASKGGNFVTRALDRAGQEGRLRMVDDQRLSPTFTLDLARALVAGVERGAAGVVHLTAEGSCSWGEFTRAILEEAGVEAELELVATETRPGSAQRPLNGVLARPGADAAGLPALPHWHDGLRRYMSLAGLAGDQPANSKGSSSATSLSRRADESRREGTSSATGHSIPTSGSS